MKGAIDYLRELSRICRDQDGDCTGCTLRPKNKDEVVKCPWISPPGTWTDEMTTEMVKIGGAK